MKKLYVIVERVGQSRYNQRIADKIGGCVPVNYLWHMYRTEEAAKEHKKQKPTYLGCFNGFHITMKNDWDQDWLAIAEDNQYGSGEGKVYRFAAQHGYEEVVLVDEVDAFEKVEEADTKPQVDYFVLPFNTDVVAVVN